MNVKNISRIYDINLGTKKNRLKSRHKHEYSKWFYGNCSPDNYPLDSCPLDNYPPHNCPPDKCSQDNCPSTQLPSAKLPPRQLAPGQLPLDNYPPNNCPAVNYFRLIAPDNSFKQNTLFILSKFDQTLCST